MNFGWFSLKFNMSSNSNEETYIMKGNADDMMITYLNILINLGSNTLQLRAKQQHVFLYYSRIYAL